MPFDEESNGQLALPEEESLPVIKAKQPVAELAFLFFVGVSVAALFYQLTPIFLNWLSSVTFRTELSQDVRRYMPISQVGATILGFVIGLGIGNLVYESTGAVRRRWDRMPVGGKVTAVVAVFLGLMGSVPFLFFLNALLSGNYLVLIAAMMVLMLGFSTVSIYVLKSIEDVLPWNQGQVRTAKSDIKIFDTNVIIDGRLNEILETGFLQGPYYVPGFVLEELQHIADSADGLRRQRGRRGLEILREMQSKHKLDVGNHDKLGGNSRDEVDQRLIRVARALGASIVTNDWNLNRVASLQEVRILNINHLALALRPSFLPSEAMHIMIVKEGNQINQGVGYLEDGTMVVVDNGKRFMNQTIEVVVSQMIQTERGKMVFATPAVDVDYHDDPRSL